MAARIGILVYDETIRVLKSAVQSAKLGREEELAALKRLDDRARALESHVTGPSLDVVVGGERAQSHGFGGRSVYGWEPPNEALPDGKRAG